MNFLADESVDRPIVERLRREGHPVLYIAELGPGMCTGSDYLDTVLQLRPPFAWHQPDGLRGVT
jgi:hypothetical protein